MANFTAKDVMELRELTGAGMMDCKKALVECDGDMEKAKDYLREKGIAKAVKKAGRIAAEGIVGSYICDACKVGVLVEVNCETDFVAKTDAFKAFVVDIAEQIAKKNPADVDELLAQESIKEAGVKVSEVLLNATAKIGEKISVRRFTRLEGFVDCYIHMGGKIGVLVQVDAEADKAVLHDVAMQIAAAKPAYLRKEEVPQDEIEHEKEILRVQAKSEPKPKPDAIIEKMVNGRIEKYYKEVCLLEQPFVKDTDKSVAQMINGAFQVLSFVRYEMGEGLQKREDNFAEEVMGQMK